MSDSLTPSRDTTLSRPSWFWLVALVAALPLVVTYIYDLWGLERYRFVPFCIGGVIWLCYARTLRYREAPLSWLAIATLAVGALVVITGNVVASPWFVAVGAVVIATVFLSRIEGVGGGSLLYLSIPLFLVIRPPLGYDQLLVIELQRITSSLSHLLLDVIGVPHSLAGYVIQLPSRELFVAEACSGIQSVFSLAFATMFYQAFMRRVLWLTPLYIAVAVALAIFANVVRVTTVALSEYYFSFDLSEGWRHEGIGLLVLFGSVLLLMSFDQLILLVFHSVETLDWEGGENWMVDIYNRFIGTPVDGIAVDAKSIAMASSPLPVAADGVRLSSKPLLSGDSNEEPTLNWFKHWIPISVAMGIALVGVQQVYALKTRNQASTVLEDVVFEPPAGLFDQGIGNWSYLDHRISRGKQDPRLGQNADQWTLKAANLQGELVLSQPYHGWHELCICYENLQWLLVNRQTVEVENDRNEPDIAFARFKRSNGDLGYLFYSAMTPENGVMAPPSRPGRLESRFVDLLYQGDAFNAENVMMMQFWVVSPEPLSSIEIAECAQTFAIARSQLEALATNTPLVVSIESNTDEKNLQTGEIK